jgi:hypothetical protein
MVEQVKGNAKFGKQAVAGVAAKSTFSLHRIDFSWQPFRISRFGYCTTFNSGNR